MVTLKGREIYNKDEAVELLMKFQEDIGEVFLFTFRLSII